MPSIPYDADRLEDPVSESAQLREWRRILNESVRLDWVDMAEKTMTPAERRELRAQIGTTVERLAEIIKRLDELDANRP